ncbi:Rho GTPase-activating protein 10 [Tupaia chinensis]|uniref:Rho GTPase-activating protein 10 n=1 Tax=Tupaia chinensis TaxID=246437 RepID=L9L4I3_TUPCH|nr:Rho GTPase-activating protein 10 [Tupaia chinensis]
MSSYGDFSCLLQSWSGSCSGITGTHALAYSGCEPGTFCDSALQSVAFYYCATIGFLALPFTVGILVLFYKAPCENTSPGAIGGLNVLIHARAAWSSDRSLGSAESVLGSPPCAESVQSAAFKVILQFLANADISLCRTQVIKLTGPTSWTQLLDCVFLTNGNTCHCHSVSLPDCAKTKNGPDVPEKEQIWILIRALLELGLSAAQRKFAHSLRDFKFEFIGDAETDDERCIDASLREFSNFLKNLEEQREIMVVEEFLDR